jgi:hypothetical protein
MLPVNRTLPSANRFAVCPVRARNIGTLVVKEPSPDDISRSQSWVVARTGDSSGNQDCSIGQQCGRMTPAWRRQAPGCKLSGRWVI